MAKEPLNNSQRLTPSFDDLLELFKANIFATMNCVQIGKIEKFTKGEQTAEIQIQVKRQVNDKKSVAYPVLVDCPVVVLQGGGAFLEFPIAKGDYCVVLFNDRDIDNWWDSATVAEPSSSRKHNLSDGMALVGLNPKSNVLPLAGDKVFLNAADHNLSINSTKQIDFNGGTDFAVRYNELKTQFDQLKTDHDNVVALVKAHTHVAPSGTTDASSTLQVLAPSTADLTNAKIAKINLPGVGE